MEISHQKFVIDHVLRILRKDNVLFDDDSHYLEKIVDKFEKWQKVLDCQNDPSTYCYMWNSLVETLFLSPEWFSFLYPKVVESNPSVLTLIKTFRNTDLCPPNKYHDVLEQRSRWLTEQSDLNNENSLIRFLFLWLTELDPDREPGFRYTSVITCFADLLYGCFVAPELKPIQNRVLQHHYQQYRSWNNSYCHGYAYQGYLRIGIRGIKPTEPRINSYEIGEYLDTDKSVLDIGSNAGFMAIHLSEQCLHVDALEYNPFLCLIGQSVAEALNVRNVSFIQNDFHDFLPDKTYDIVFSLANHATIDNNLSMNFEDYIAKIYAIMNMGGVLFFESHNVFGSGTGQPGDDGDLNKKFDIVERYFMIEKFKMTRRFVEKDDIDKLFIVLRKKPSYDATAVRTFVLKDAIQRYQYESAV